MIAYANAKINIGLNITEKRADGYHSLESIFYPYPIYDIIELHPKASGMTSLEITGIDLAPDADNLCLRAYDLLAERYSLPPVHIHLHKQIPFGAGLGGGSSDAAALLKMLNAQCALGLSEKELCAEASRLGADCPFFIINKPMYAIGIGTDLSAVDLDLSEKYIVLIKPNVHVSTAEAYRGVSPRPAEFDLVDSLKLPLQDWKFYIKNDFEDSIFLQYPEIQDVKLFLYEQGAVYASMSGSGSTVYGIFDEPVTLDVPDELGKVYYPLDIG
ncbi:4-(cytidine 5'-diphospho)-2-C-methyl-D-erythritol kinase [Sphingobacterium deserti]|uniref:4-diphosphocytidyl-2-C-methyl-D-erythritol kinase n=1 Tax=Sphingobacterium deserti TaxID=1229276 RepID=A0A0B8SZD3_9SPHI|nr:4-(cytidine 5'-diphospho)-2-C-methyl-D-erythritol kinase [Sphingobacterium deserti]KGE13102.1 4-diphosphocytidyl-2-C-methyl-D-erythritol kinase [Sphingobacterium deserti]